MAVGVGVVVRVIMAVVVVMPVVMIMIVVMLAKDCVVLNFVALVVCKR